MNLRLTLAGLALALVVAGSASAGTKEYKAICSSARLAAAERADCKKQMNEAGSDADRTAVFKMYDMKIAGFAPDGTRLTAKNSDTPLVQDAQAPK